MIYVAVKAEYRKYQGWLGPRSSTCQYPPSSKNALAGTYFLGCVGFVKNSVYAVKQFNKLGRYMEIALILMPGKCFGLRSVVTALRKMEVDKLRSCVDAQPI